MCSLTKEKTALVIPNAIQICSDSDKHFFCSFGARDKTYVVLFRTWQQALLDQVLFIHSIELIHLSGLIVNNSTNLSNFF